MFLSPPTRNSGGTSTVFVFISAESFGSGTPMSRKFASYPSLEDQSGSIKSFSSAGIPASTDGLVADTSTAGATFTEAGAAASPRETVMVSGTVNEILPELDTGTP